MAVGMRWLLLLALTACAGSTHAMRVRAVDGVTGQPMAGERLTVKTFLTSESCEHDERSKPWPVGRVEGRSADTDIDNTSVTTGADGWTTIRVIDSQGLCDFRRRKVEIYARGAFVEVDVAKPAAYVPVWIRRVTPEPGKRTYATHRAKDAFTPRDAVASVYAERFVRVGGHEPTVFASADTFLVGATPEIHADRDGDDPFLRVALARVTPSGTAWHVEMEALAQSETAPRYVVPPGYEDQRGSLDEWAAAMLDEVVLRAATAAKIIDRDYLSTHEWKIVTRLDGAAVSADIFHDPNPYDGEPAKQPVSVRGTLARRDGRWSVEGLTRVVD
jgi:hypothetical protein